MIKKNQQCLNLAQMQIIFNSRIYWRERSVWLRALMSSNYEKLGVSKPIFSQLLKNAQKQTEVLIPIFGREAAEQYNWLASQHRILTHELIGAQLRNDDEEINQIVNSLYQNNRRRATFLASINPFWNEDKWINLMDTELYFTIEEANALASGDYNKSVFLFDRIMSHADLMGNYLASGLYSYITLSPQAPGIGLGKSRIKPVDQCITYPLMEFIYSTQIFWFDMTIWTRIHSIARTVNPDYAEKAYAKLRRIPIQYGKLLKTVFDNELVDELLVLIYEQIDLINNLVTAQLDRNIEEINKIVLRLYQNADERATLFARANPYVDQGLWKNTLNGYMRNTIERITAYLAGDYDRDITIFQRLLEKSAHISNEFSESLLKYLSQPKTER